MGKTGRFVERMFKARMVTVYLPRAGDLIYAIYWFYRFRERKIGNAEGSGSNG